MGKKKKKKLKLAMKKKLLKGLSFQICRKLMTNPIIIPCACNFCKTCFEGVFAESTAPVNTQLMHVIESLKKERAKKEEYEGSGEESSATQKTANTTTDTDDSDESCYDAGR
ncbi:hypothetical protein K2173_025125 [Erythroxylum novogranatense]|uniref:Uncharacterized protein n=1 Tax=Erythroxylum novogranatense TaxID=1862640 RepID=A0AAV8SVU2_9ROSI|nr:hypothetical protein K2173_025125 [Erythroxylum novogranatense]